MKIVMSAAIIVAGLCCSSSFASTGLTLTGALSEGIENNPQLKISNAALKEAQWKKKESFGGFLPKLDIVASHFFDLKYQH